MKSQQKCNDLPSLKMPVTITLFALLICFFQQTNLNAQKHFALGANVLTKEEYQKLPRANWDSLVKYSPKMLHPDMTVESQSKALNTQTSVMLSHTPPIGDQGGEASCVGWATGYCATGILDYPKYNFWDFVSERSPAYVYKRREIALGIVCHILMVNVLFNQTLLKIKMHL
jgi:hypothetical protein